MKFILRTSLLAIALLGISLAALVSGAHAQSPTGLTAQVDADRITTDDTVTLTLTLTAADMNGQQLALPPLDGFDTVGTQSGSRYNIVNGAASSSIIYAYRLKPTRTGDITIPALHLDLNGQTLSSDAITVHVTQGNGTPTKKNNAPSNAGGGANGIFGNDPFGNFFGNDPFGGDPFNNDLFNSNANLDVRATTNTSSVYVGQPVQYTVGVSSNGMLMGDPQYDPPKFTGFWAHQPPDTTQGANGSAITTLLFPTKAGTLTIDPATISADGGFFGNSLQRKTDPVTIEVQALPQGAPAGFNGAVGQFKISASPDKTSTRVGEPIVLHVEISGSGNFDTLPDPQWQNDTAWRAYDAKSKTAAQVVRGNLSGGRSFDRTLIPTQAGALTIPAVRYVYFDPSDAQYHTVQTQPVTIQVAPGDPATTQNIASPGANGGTNAAPASAPANAATLPALKAAPAQLTSAAAPLASQPLFWALFLIPIGLVTFDLAWGWRNNFLSETAATRRSSRALKKALRALRRAHHARNVPVSVAAIVQTFLQDKLDRSLNGVPHSALAQILHLRGAGESNINAVVALLRGGETVEYGDSDPRLTGDLVNFAAATLTALDKELTA